MLKKTFICYMLGTTFPWYEQWLLNVEPLGEFGWEWKIFTPNDVKGCSNVEVIYMDAKMFCDLVEKELGLRPKMRITDGGVPSVHITDFHVFSGVLLKDYLKDSDFWGMTGMDIVFGRLDHFVPDSLLEDCDIYTDEPNIINGTFSLYKNTYEINNLFRKIVGWQKAITQQECPRCALGHGPHTLMGTDEFGLDDVMKANETLRYKYPPYYPFYSYDRLYQHIPKPMIEMQEDGSLWERFHDVSPPKGYRHFLHGYIAREISYFHFIKSKTYPKIGTYQELP